MMRNKLSVSLAPLRILALGMLAIMVLAIGCSTTKETESLLSEAGFKMIPAKTPQQLAHLKTLPRNKVTMVVREGKTYYVFPDTKQRLIYVGQQAQYDVYAGLRGQRQLAQDLTATTNSERSWAAWESWGGIGLIEPAPWYRR
jgi:hypothetical protein